MSKIKQAIQDPGFQALSRDQQIRALGKLDSGFGLMTASQQNKALDKLIISNAPPTPEPGEEKGFLGKATDRFGPTALVKGASSELSNPENLENLQEFYDDPAEKVSQVSGKDLWHKSVPGMVMDALGSSFGNAWEKGKLAYEDYKRADNLPDQYLAGLDAVGSLPIIGSLRESGDDLFPRDPNQPIDPSATGGFAGEILNLLLPNMVSKLGSGLEAVGKNRFRAALGPGTGKETELLDNVLPKLMDEPGLPSFTQRSLEEKLIGNGPNITSARSKLGTLKGMLPGGTGTVDIDPLKTATEKVAMGGRPMRDTVPGLGDLPQDPSLAAKAREANDLVKYYQESAGTSLVDPLSGTSKGMVTPRDLQTLKEAVQERARQGKLYDARQGTVTPQAEVYGGQAGMADDMLTNILPELGPANERIHALLTGGETVKANRLGRIEGFAPPSELSMVRNPTTAAGAMGIGPLLGKFFRGIMTPLNTTGGVGAYRSGQGLNRLTPEQIMLLNTMGSRSDSQAILENLGIN